MPGKLNCDRWGIRMVLVAMLLMSGLFANSQSNRYWTRSFNEESSLLSGAVVGGGVGPSAIYYNPAAIADVQNSSLSFHASLFSLEVYNIKNVLGDGISLNSSRLQVQPRFISYLLHPKNEKRVSIEFAFLNNELFRLEFNQTVDDRIDILENIEGEERYFANFQFRNQYRDDWVGLGFSFHPNSRLFLGSSMFVSVKSSEYYNLLDISAFPVVDTISGPAGDTPFYSATYQELKGYKFNNYRLVWKFGMLYKSARWSFGITIKTPSLNIFSDGKRINNKVKQSNISDSETGEFYPDYIVVDASYKKDVEVNMKDPFSVAAGFTFYAEDSAWAVFTTVEYFNRLKPYSFIHADAHPDFAGNPEALPFDASGWLSFGNGASSVLNVGVGYRWKIRKDLELLAGGRTDFNYRKNIDNEIKKEYQTADLIRLDLYHITGGLRARIFGQDLILGGQYSFGANLGRQQIINLSSPEEFNEEEMKPLQGTRNETMRVFLNSLSIYFGATFNIGGEQ